MIDIILFFQRIWEIALYILVWLVIQLLIIAWRWRSTASNLRRSDRPYGRNFPD